MWTNNMKKLISAMFGVNNYQTFKPILTDGIEYNSNYFTAFPFGNNTTTLATAIIKNETISISNQASGKFGLLVGIGDTEPTVEDYALANQVVLDTVSFQCTNSNGTLFPTVTHTMTNNSGGTLVITEIGLYIGIYSNTKPCLLGRKLLETPVTMENGQSYTFQYNIDLTNLQE